MPRLMARSSSPPVSTSSPRLPMTIAVPVSWHIGSTPPAAMLAFFSRSRATNLSLADASGSSRIRTQLLEVRRPQPVRDVAERGLREQGERLGRDLEERASGGVHRRHALGGEQPVGRLVGADREQLGERERRSSPMTVFAAVRWGHVRRRVSHRARHDGRGPCARVGPLGSADAAGGGELPHLGAAGRAGPDRSAGLHQGSGVGGQPPARRAA